MSWKQQPPRFWLISLLGFCMLLLAGCAGLRVPRIDPTGERIFIWPRDQVPATNPFPAIASSNAQAQPVFTDPVFPRQVVPATAQIPVPPIPQDTLSLKPERVLAPVGSEVILRAGICNTEGYLLTHQPMQWTLAQDDVGEFVSVGGRGWLRQPLLPWNQSRKVDNQYATGYTAAIPLRITRGTADPSDDVQIEPGEAWASITSAVEGTSHVTAITSAVQTWSQRKASSTIYWVDVAWTFPPATVTSSSQPQVLTTMVQRQTDGIPLEGWIVRYQVAGGGGTLGGSSTQEVEVRTDATGRATIEVTPTDGVGGTTQIQTELIRPANLAGSPMPRLTVGKGATTVQWTDTPAPYLSPQAIPTTPIPDNAVPLPSVPPTIARRPRLELEIREPPDVEVNGQARFEVILHNRGDAEATGIVLTDRFDEGLSHLSDSHRHLEIENAKIGNLAAGDSRTEFLSFTVLQAGRLCHEARITCREGSQDTKQACVNAIQPLPQKQASMEVRKEGPRQSVVGKKALFTIVVKNTGEVPLTNIEIADEYDNTLRALPVKQGYEVINGRFVWKMPRLEVGKLMKLEVECECLQATPKACGLVTVTADGQLIRRDAHCVEVIPPLHGGAGPANPQAAGNLRLSISSFQKTVQVGKNATYEVVVRNIGNTEDKDIFVRVTFPPQMTPDASAVQAPPNVAIQHKGNEITFGPIVSIRSGETRRFTMPASANQPGTVHINAKLISQGMPQGLQVTEQIEILSR